MKVYILPQLEHAPYGILRVVEAMHKHLPDTGVEIVDTPKEADVINCHAMTWASIPHKPIVHSSHGLYWGEFGWPDDHLQANAKMIGVMKRAKAITTPSQWVARAISRGMLRQPVVIHHGVDPDEWQPGTNQGYVLWNKARADIVSNPEDMQKLAESMSDIGFVSTLGDEAANVQITDPVDYATMKDMVSQAGVYLATARETFGIGTIEAMACGVPVAGWNHGGQREIIKQGETGYLAPPGDYKALAECVRRCLSERDRLGQNARQDVLDRWLWPDKIEQYAATFLTAMSTRPVKVSIIVTAHNLAKYLPDCLESVGNQTMGDWECLIVDDQSEDETPEIAHQFEKEDHRFRYLRTPVNLKLSGARNYGIDHANGEYLLPLDADDALLPNALNLLATALDDDDGTHIAYGHLDTISDDGGNRKRNDWPFDKFDWFAQMAHLNQLPYSSMVRHQVMENSGGYRLRDWRAEDASLWCRATSLGFEARKVTEESTLLYRVRGDGKSAEERKAGHTDGDWTSWFPWRIAGNVSDGVKFLREGKRPEKAIVPFGSQGTPPNGHCWPVWSHHDPLVSVVIPVGPDHEKYLMDALDSVQSQTFPFWEAVVVNDTGKPLDVCYAPWVTVVDTGTHNIADSRNAGIAKSVAPLVLFLDADDLLMPTAMMDMIKKYVEMDGSKYIYTDWFAIEPDGVIKAQGSRDYIRNGRGIHPISVLVERSKAMHVGGFDRELPGWEDWDFFCKLAIAGFCGQRIDRPLLVYRTFSGLRREQSFEDAFETLPILRDRYEDFFQGKKKMSDCCSGNATTIIEAKRRLNMLKSPSLGEPIVSDGMVRVKYSGHRMGTISISSVSGVPLSQTYTFAATAHHRYANAPESDAKLLVESGICTYAKQMTGIDLTQAAVRKPELPPMPPPEQQRVPDYMKPPTPPPVPSFTAPEPVPERTSAELGELVAKNVKDLRGAIVGMTVAELKIVQKLEMDGKNRKGALSAINMILEDAERVG